jgi:hypothetical protein
MSMSSAISMNVRGLVTVRAGRMLNMTAGITVVIRGGFPCCGLGGGDKRCLKGERQHRHHHDDGAHTPSKTLRNAPQLLASAMVHYCQVTPNGADQSTPRVDTSDEMLTRELLIPLRLGWARPTFDSRQRDAHFFGIDLVNQATTT